MREKKVCLFIVFHISYVFLFCVKKKSFPLFISSSSSILSLRSNILSSAQVILVVPLGFLGGLLFFSFSLHFSLSPLQYFYLLTEFYLKSWVVLLISVSLMFVFSWASLRHFSSLSSSSWIFMELFLCVFFILLIWISSRHFSLQTFL